MKAAKTWCVTGLVVLAAFSLASCGKDEADGKGNGGSGSIVPKGGNSGNGGSGGGRTGGTSATAGSGGSTVDAAATKLGRGCLDDDDCTDSTAPGLKCLNAQDNSLGDGAPPKGLCTAPCESTAECAEFGPDALCYPFSEDASYCIEGCSFGEPGLGEKLKCHNRVDFACYPALLGDTGDECAESADCQGGELCIDATCAVVFPGCLPSCRGDLDCDDGMYCDQSFLSGVCVAEKPTGKALGEPCTVPAEGEPENECLGFCQADSDTGDAGHCSETCGLLGECGWNGATSKYDGACFYASGLTNTAETAAPGDFGFCAPTCNCSEECNNAELACSLLSTGPLPDVFRGPGLCFTPDAETVEHDQCGAAGSGSGGSDGMGGMGGGAGTPSGEGGAGAAP